MAIETVPNIGTAAAAESARPDARYAGTRLPAGVYVMSLDTELAWGSMHRGSYDGHEKEYARTRGVIDDLLGLLEQFEIRATWAVVGHLFLAGCQPVNGRKHPEIERPGYSWFKGDWFDRDPATGMDRDPWWYGPDIIEKVLRCRVPQEIACHNFSHAIVGDSGYSAAAFASELDACQQLAGGHALTLRSFVFPRNAVGHLDELAARGYLAFRGVEPSWAWHAGPLARAARFVDAFLPFGAPVSAPVFESGLWNIPASYNYLHRSGWGRLVPVRVRAMRSLGGLHRAARDHAVFHLWTHPFNLASDPKGLLGGLRVIFHEVKALRESGLIRDMTMAGLAGAVQQASVAKGESWASESLA